ncbi:hypothetical protein BKA70DRAFT_1430980 [Coprinopsis sp. MPI-PUGE-AT-0042]|nr:hypothetical protein BKA70DRAFT_1430980 [Coprinopsis sp. MPI-PUGE-AT-0042]
MLDFTVLSDADWVSFLDFLSLRVQLALKGTQRLEWANVHMQVAAEVDNACFCIAIAHFHSSTLCYNDAFMSALATCWADVFPDTDVSEDSVPDQSGDSLDNETGSVATPNHCDPTSASGIVPPPSPSSGSGAGAVPPDTGPHTSSNYVPSPSNERILHQNPSTGLNLSPIAQLLKEGLSVQEMPNAWWDDPAAITPLINPLTALHFWREYRSTCNDPTQQVIWPSKKLLNLWQSYCDALDEVQEPQATHILHIYQGAVAQTAETIEAILKAILYPIYPKFHRPLAPHDPGRVLNSDS